MKFERIRDRVNMLLDIANSNKNLKEFERKTMQHIEHTVVEPEHVVVVFISETYIYIIDNRCNWRGMCQQQSSAKCLRNNFRPFHLH